MKKYLFLGWSSLFLFVLFWQFNQLNYNGFTFFNFLENLILLSPTFLKTFSLILTFLGSYFLGILFFSYFAEKLLAPLTFVFLPSLLLLYFSETEILVYFLLCIFFLLSLLVFSCARNTQNTYLKISFTPVANKCFQTIGIFLLILISVYSYAITPTKTLDVPRSLIEFIADKFLLNSENMLDESLCDNPKIDQTNCLAQIQASQIEITQILSKEQVYQMLNQKIKTTFSPYNKQIPYGLAISFFIFNFSLLSLLNVIYCFFAFLIYHFLKLIHLYEVDLHTTTQEYLK